MPVLHSQTLLCEWPRNSGLNNDTLTPFCFLLWGIWVQCLEEQQPTSLTKISCCCCSLMSDYLQSHGLQHTRLLFAPLSPVLCSNSYPLNQWCCLIISSSATPFSFNFQPFPASGSFPMSHLFTSSDQSIAALASASVLLMNIQYIAGCLLYIGFSKLEWMNERMVGSGAKEVSQHVKRVRKDR